MRKIHIDFTSEKRLPNGSCLGQKGEHNATELIIKPPVLLSENEELINYVIAFQIGVHKVFHTEFLKKQETLTYKLPKKVTQSNLVSLQLEGYDNDSNLIVKSEIVEGLYFEKSVCGKESELDGNVGLVAQIAANTMKLNNFSEDENGNLLYKGKEISGERPTAMTSENDSSSSEWYGIIADTSSMNNIGFKVFDAKLRTDPNDENSPQTVDVLPDGTEIKTIEFLYNGNWIDIHQMHELDNKPYIINMNKVYCDKDSGENVYAVVYFPNGSLNTIAEQISFFGIEKIRVTYYTD